MSRKDGLCSSRRVQHDVPRRTLPGYPATMAPSLLIPWSAVDPVCRVEMATPFLSDPLQRGCNQGEPLIQFEAGGRKRMMSIVGQSTSDSKTILPCNDPFLILFLLDFSFNRTNTTNLLFQFFLSMTIRLVDWFRRFAQVMKVTQLMRNI
jgi:hypothetical protein